MPRTNIAAQTLAGAYPVTPLAGGSADITWVTADILNGNHTPLINDKTVLLARNTDVGAQTVSVLSTPDTLNREGDITDYSIGAGKVARFGPFKTVGWANAGKLEFDGATADVEFAVITLP